MAKQITVETSSPEKDHRAAWIGAGAGAAVIAGVLHGGVRGYRLPHLPGDPKGIVKRGNLIDRIEARGAEKMIERQKQQKRDFETSVVKHASRVLSEWGDRMPEYHGATIHDYDKIKKSVIPTTTPLYQYAREGRAYYETAALRHAKISFKNPKAKDFVYWTRPHDEKTPPKPGRFVDPGEYHHKLINWATEEGRKRAVAEKNKLAELSRLFQFDVTLKEGRNAQGRFTSGGMMSSPRDMQDAYHAPVIRQQEQQPSKAGKLARYAVGAAGGALAIGGLIAGSAPFWKKEGQAIARAEAEKAEKAAARNTLKEAQKTVAPAVDPNLKARLAIAENELQHQEEIGKLNNKLTTASAREEAERKARLTAEGKLKTAMKTIRKKDITNETLRAVQAGTATPVATGMSILGREQPFYVHEDAARHFRIQLNDRLGKANTVVTNTQKQLGEAKTDHQRNLLNVKLDAYKTKVNELMSHHEHFKTVADNPTTAGWDELKARIINTEAKQKARVEAGEAAVRKAYNEAKENKLPKNDPLADAIAIQAQGMGAVSKKGGRAKSKQPGKRYEKSRGGLDNLIQLARTFERLTLPV